MKTLELNRMEQLQGGFDWERCAVTGIATAIHLSGFGPWGFFGGLAGGCLIGQLQ
jgi:hypothetical protein